MSAWTKLFALLASSLLHTSSAICFKSKGQHCGHFKADSFPRYTWTGTNLRFPTDDIRHDFVDSQKFIMQNSIQTRFQVTLFSIKKSAKNNSRLIIYRCSPFPRWFWWPCHVFMTRPPSPWRWRISAQGRQPPASSLIPTGRCKKSATKMQFSPPWTCSSIRW